jgi:hypothetical protein
VPSFKVRSSYIWFHKSFQTPYILLQTEFSEQGVATDLLGIIKAKQDANGKQLDLNPRIKLMFGVTQLKVAVQELDDTASALDRFTRMVLSN